MRVIQVGAIDSSPTCTTDTTTSAITAGPYYCNSACSCDCHVCPYNSSVYDAYYYEKPKDDFDPDYIEWKKLEQREWWFKGFKKIRLYDRQKPQPLMRRKMMACDRWD